MQRRLLLASALLASSVPTRSRAAGPANTERLAAQRRAMESFVPFDGLWRGDAQALNPDGSRLQLVQTERFGPMLDGTIRVVEGRGYTPDGQPVFNAFAVISFAPDRGTYGIRSWAQGFGGDFPLELVPGGYAWTLPAGPAQLRYTATIENGQWVELGERIVAGRPPQRTFEMRLRRMGSTDWPAAGEVPR